MSKVTDETFKAGVNTLRISIDALTIQVQKLTDAVEKKTTMDTFKIVDKAGLKKFEDAEEGDMLSDGFMVIKCKYDGQCRVCGKPYEKGDLIEWKRDGGARCLGEHR